MMRKGTSIPTIQKTEKSACPLVASLQTRHEAFAIWSSFYIRMASAAS
jgi:hypothetical protein